jgi:hypothetical protein
MFSQTFDLSWAAQQHSMYGGTRSLVARTAARLADASGREKE